MKSMKQGKHLCFKHSFMTDNTIITLRCDFGVTDNKSYPGLNTWVLVCFLHLHRLSYKGITSLHKLLGPHQQTSGASPTS